MEIELPDGTILEAPDDADVKQVVQGYQRTRERAIARERARISYSAMPTGQRIFAGFGRPFAEAGYGIKDLASKIGVGKGLTDKDRITLERLEQIHGGAGTAGRVVGEIGLFAAPSSMTAKLATKLPQAMARYAPRVVTDIAASAVIEALKAPTDSTSRGERAAWGAAGAGAGHVLGKALGATIRGMTPSPAALQFLRDNIPLTPGMMKGGVLKEIEQRLADVPIVGGAIRKRQQQALEAWNRNLLNRVMPEGEAQFAGHEGFKQATQAFKDSYAKLWDQPISLDIPHLQSFWKQTVDDSQRALAPEASNALHDKLYRTFVDNVLPARSGQQLSGATISKLDDELRHEALLAARRGMGDQAQLFTQARQQLRSLLPQSVATELGRIDGLYAQFVRLRRAASYKGAAANQGVFTPDQLLSAATALDKSAGKGATARGDALLQREATDALDVLSTPSRRPTGTLERAALAAGSFAALPLTLPARAAYSSLGQRIARGETWPQELLNGRIAHALVNALRLRGVTPATTGAAVEDEP